MNDKPKTSAVSFAKTSAVSFAKTSAVSFAKTSAVSFAKTSAVSFAKTSAVSFAKTSAVSFAKTSAVSFAKTSAVSFAKTSAVSFAKTSAVSFAKNLTIGAFAKAAGVNVETIRLYQRRGLLPEPDKPPGSIRRYGAADVARVRFIKRAQQLGFSLDEIGELLKLEDGVHCGEARRLAAHKLEAVRARLADLLQMEAMLADLVKRCDARRGKLRCPLIDELSMQDKGTLAPTNQERT